MLQLLPTTPVTPVGPARDAHTGHDAHTGRDAHTGHDAPRWATGLTETQREAVQHRGAPLLVAAGAGSGKTRTLAARTASLLDEGVPPERILLLTFTRRAAAELLDRVAAMVPDGDTRRVGGGTFHRLAVHTLRTHGGELGLAPRFGVLDRADAVDLMSIVRAELDLAAGDHRAPSAGTLVDVLSRCVTAGEPLDDVLADRFGWVARHRLAIGRCFDAFTTAKRSSGVLDLDDLQLHLRALLKHDRVGPRITAGWDHVLVDEVQDVDPIQLDLLGLLCSGGAELTVVGDELQAIYGFRAGDGRGIRRFHAQFADAVTIDLSRSFRCPASVLAVANAVGAPVAPDRPPLLDDGRPGVPPTLTQCLDPGDEATLVADRILAAREEGVALQQQVVLFRTGHHAGRLELELARRDIPYRKFGGLRYLDTAHVRDLMSVLRLLDTPHDQLAWHRTLRSLRGIGPVAARHIAATLGVGDATLTPDPVARFIQHRDQDVFPGDQDDLALLRTALAAAAGDGDSEPPPPIQIDAVLGLLEHTLPRRHRDAADRVADLAELAAAAAGYTHRRDLLADLALDRPNVSGAVDPGNVDEEWLTLSTIHSAKGGEWDVVHLIHAADGNIPSDLAARRSQDMDEERRLTYVAVTRARRELHVTYPTRYPAGHGPRDARDAHAQVSRFLGPIDHLFTTGVSRAATTPDAPCGPVAQDGPLVDAVDRELAGLW
jgi:DNA helicase-2/ATP-dependent DNA helicase PcrA